VLGEATSQLAAQSCCKKAERQFGDLRSCNKSA